MAQILDGRALAQSIKAGLKEEVSNLKRQTGRIPTLVSLMVGNDHDAVTYTNSQRKVASDIGINYELRILPQDITQKDFIQIIKLINNEANIHGVIIQKPVPKKIEYQDLANALAVEKDIEGISVANLGQLMLGSPKIIPCTAAAAMAHVEASGVNLRGKEVVVVGRSEIVGKPVSLLLLQKGATVSICHSGTSESGKLAEYVAKADVLVVAVGKSNFIKGEWIKPGSVVVDVGINELNGKIVGDVEFDSAKERAGFITPVPGGVGPVTVMMLMKNLIEAFKIQN